MIQNYYATYRHVMLLYVCIIYNMLRDTGEAQLDDHTDDEDGNDDKNIKPEADIEIPELGQGFAFCRIVIQNYFSYNNYHLSDRDNFDGYIIIMEYFYSIYR